MKRAFSLALICAISITACRDKEAQAKKTADKYEDTKLSLEEIEKQTPAKFISVAESDKKNLLRQRVVKRKVTNNAKMATFKDIDLKISFYSKTGVLLEEDQETIYETLAPGTSASFKSKYFAAKGTDSIAIKVMSAKVGDKK